MNKKQSSMGSIILIVIFSLIIIAMAFVMANLDSLKEDTNDSQTVENIFDYSEQQVVQDEVHVNSSTGKKTSFPVSFASNNIQRAAVVNSRIFVISRDTISCISASGEVKYYKALNFVEPIMKTSNKYCLVFDRQSSKYMIFNKNKLVRTGESEEKAQIITAEIADDGSYMISSRRSGSTSMLTYYSKNGEKLFQWTCANEHIIALAISSNKKSLACAAINSQSGDIYTKIYYFDINSSENNKNFKIKSTVAMDIFFVSNSNVIAVCNNKRILVDCKTNDAKPISVDFNSSILARANDQNGNTAVVSKKIDSFNQYELSVYDSKNALVYTSDVDDDIVDITCDKKKVYILGSNKILMYNSSGGLSDTVEIDSASIGITLGNGKLYHYSQGYLFGAV
ncbi:MAG: DUF5711 family protein [Faecalibacterium sp.]|nr:DUF5711 family protein [Ruminococcus sp.]MCM1392639.1 DUF5711 family protein [Ruminococcus sp.]MCM1486356.1 DUF5711 family protein [Faecalibacterium sp.]